MKMTLTFSAEALEDEEELRAAFDGSRYKQVLSDILEWLRRQYKYDAGDIPGEQAQVVKDFIIECLNEWKLEV